MTTAASRQRGRPRLRPDLQLVIVQKRSLGFSIDKIRVELEREVAEGKWDKPPSRGAIQNVVNRWDNLDSEIRDRELPFVWDQLERARIPWEASRWVLECQAHHEAARIHYAVSLINSGEPMERMDLLVAQTGRFTNRLATWSWRVHQASIFAR